MTILHQVVGVLAIVAASASAALWGWSARMRIHWSAFGTFNGPAPSVMMQLQQQAKISAWAAIATGASAIFQAIGLWV